MCCMQSRDDLGSAIATSTTSAAAGSKASFVRTLSLMGMRQFFLPADNNMKRNHPKAPKRAILPKNLQFQIHIMPLP